MLYAEKFYNMFQEKVSQATDDDKAQYSENKSWTEKVIPWIEEILSKLSCNTEVNREYYKIDVIGWKQQKEDLSVGETGLKKHLWDLLFAVEHENNSKEWLDEVCKLSYIRCPLRVVIGYNQNDADEKMKIAKDILTKTRAFTDEDQEFLIMLGPSEVEFKVRNIIEYEHTIIKKVLFRIKIN